MNIPTLNQTLRQVLGYVNLNRVFVVINNKDKKNVAKCDRPPLKTTIEAYTKVIDELLHLPPTSPCKLSWYVKYETDWFDQHRYVDVSLFNHQYVRPNTKLKPWGGTNGKPVPKGYYDCNLDIHNEFFGAGFTPWNKMIDTPIINTTRLPVEDVVAAILYELTFWGWSNKQVKSKTKEILGRCKESIENIESGKSKSYTPKEFKKLSNLLRRKRNNH